MDENTTSDSIDGYDDVSSSMKIDTRSVVIIGVTVVSVKVIDVLGRIAIEVIRKRSK